MSQLLDYTRKNDKKSIKKIENLFLAQIFCLKRIMSQFLDYTKKLTKNRKKKFEMLS